jgi:L-iditol 2-dehydrogenase
MKAARLLGRDDLEVVSVPEPAIGPGEALVRVRAALICGTDLRMLRNGAPTLPITLGHELAGVVEEISGAVPGVKRGTPVAVAPNYGCGTCDACVAGQAHHCPDLRAIGIHVDGGFAEYVRVPAAAVAQGNLCPIPEGLSFAEAALVEPLSCVYASFERARLQPGDAVLVIGAGPIGVLHAKFHRMAGAGLVMLHDVNEARLAVAQREDPSFVIVGPDGPRERVRELTGGRGADVVVTAASSPASQQLAFQVPARDARVIFFGGLPAGQEVVPLDTNVIHYKQITVTGTTRQSLAQYRRCLRILASGRLPVRSIVTGTRPLDDAPDAFAAAARGEGLKTGFVVS